MSTPRRFFCENIDFPSSTEAEITGEEFSHAKTVLRVAAGDEVVLLDGKGGEYTAIIAEVRKNSLLAHIIRAEAGSREPTSRICLLCGALKGDKTELVVQKATELGVSEIAVFSSRYCSAYMNANKLDRLKKVAREAAKQCLRSRVPEITYFDALDDALDYAKDCKHKLFACEFASASDEDPSKIEGSVAIVVGSEGGFSEEEFESAKRRGFKGLTLGKRILRAETAAIAALSIAAFFLGELK